MYLHENRFNERKTIFFKLLRIINDYLLTPNICINNYYDWYFYRFDINDTFFELKFIKPSDYFSRISRIYGNFSEITSACFMFLPCTIASRKRNLIHFHRSFTLFIKSTHRSYDLILEFFLNILIYLLNFEPLHKKDLPIDY